MQPKVAYYIVSCSAIDAGDSRTVHTKRTRHVMEGTMEKKESNLRKKKRKIRTVWGRRNERNSNFIC